MKGTKRKKSRDQGQVLFTRNYVACMLCIMFVTYLPELKVDHEGMCNGCVQGKNIKNPFPKRDSKVEGVLELIHSDVCGPMPSSSISGKFKEFKALIENLSERKINILRSNNGGEYTSKEFVNFCKDVGIKRELTTPYNPQQNGVAERKNRTIMEVVKTMIHDQDLPMCLWAEAAMTVVYVQNRLSHSAPKGKPSQNIWLPSIYTYTEREEKQDGTLRKEGNICGIL
jgi:hypothetical protein